MFTKGLGYPISVAKATGVWGKRLALLLRAMRWTRAVAADKLECSTETLYGILRGRRPRVEFVRKLRIQEGIYAAELEHYRAYGWVIPGKVEPRPAEPRPAESSGGEVDLSPVGLVGRPPAGGGTSAGALYDAVAAQSRVHKFAYAPWVRIPGDPEHSPGRPATYLRPRPNTSD
jgi:hypothetical protein